MITPHLLAAVRKRLRTSGLSYKALGKELGVSEVTVKRILTGQRLKLERLEDIARALKVPLSELIREAEMATTAEHFELTALQEQVLADDFRLYSFFVFLVYQVPLQQVMARFKISRPRAEKYLATLDKIGIIELQRGLKFRLLIPHQFVCRKRGPIQTRILSPLSRALLKSHQERGQQTSHEFFVSRMTPALYDEFSRRFRLLAEELLTRSIREDSARADAKNFGFMLVFRPFAGSVIKSLESGLIAAPTS